MDRYSYFTLVTPRLADTLTIGVEAVFLKRKQPRLRRLFQVGAEGLEPHAPATHGCGCARPELVKRKQPSYQRPFQVGAEGLEPHAPAAHGCGCSG
jgi:hypothetical protein